MRLNAFFKRSAVTKNELSFSETDFFFVDCKLRAWDTQQMRLDNFIVSSEFNMYKL